MRNVRPFVFAVMFALGCGGSSGAPSSVKLPASLSYPGSLSAVDKTLFVASIVGPIARIAEGSAQPEIVVPQVGAAGTVLANIMIDEASKTLYACADFFKGTKENPFASPNAMLYAYDLDGHQKAVYALPNQGSSLCEDVAVDKKGAVYITDAFLGAVYTIAAPVTATSTVATWVTSPLLQPNTSAGVPPFGAHGIAVTSDSVYVNNFSTSALVRVPVRSDGSADNAHVQEERVTITNPERLIALDDTHLLITENVWCASGRLSKLTRSSDPEAFSVEVLKTDVHGASSATVLDGSYYVAESQVCELIKQLTGAGMANPILPFWIDRIDAN
jgi:hypothetical protein